MPQQRVPQIGEDVTSLMPGVGEDVTDLIEGGGRGVPQPPGKSLGGFGSNVLSSAGNFLGDTLSGVGNILGGTANIAGGLLTGDTQPLKNAVASIPDVAVAMGQHYKDRWFSGNMMENMYQDPVGMLADVSTIANPVSGIAGKIPTMGRVAKVAGTVGKYTDPFSLARVPKMPKTAEKLMKRSLGSQGKNVLRKDPDIAKKALDYGTGIDRTGANQARIDALVGDIDARIGEMAGSGATVNSAKILQSDPVTSVRREAGNQMTPSADKKVVDNTLADFYKQKGSQVQMMQQQVGKRSQPVRVPRDIPVDEVRELVSGTYKQIPKDYMKQPSDVKFSAKTAMALAAGAVDELAKSEANLVAQGIIPKAEATLTMLGQESRDRIRLQQIFQEAILAESTSRGGLGGWLASVAAGGAIGTTGNVGTASGIIAAVIARNLIHRRDVQAKIARLLNKGGRLTSGKITPTTRAADIGGRISVTGLEYGIGDEIPEPPER